MRKKSLSISEQQQLRIEISEKLEQIYSKLNETEVRVTRDAFIEKFIICETIYKMVLKKYLKVNNSFISDESMKIQLTQVKSALRRAGYVLDDSLIDRIFSGSGIYVVQGTKSAKKLRDGVEHEMNMKDLQEIVDRKIKLFADMDSFILLLQN